MLETRNENTTAVIKPELERSRICREDIKLIIKKSDFVLWMRLIWLRAENSGGLL
jgi:hypothetical protein